MKILLLFLVASFSFSGIAQTWAPFPLDETSEWRVSKTWLSDPCVVNQHIKYYLAEDTILNGNLYKVVRFSGEEFPTNGPIPHPSCEDLPVSIIGFKTAMRAENGKYFVSSNGVDEQLLFDFTLGVGDQVDGKDIDSTDYVSVNGKNCKRIWIDLNGPFWIIEGVGHANGLFEAMFDGISYLTDLMCYSEHNTPLLFGEDGNCDMTLSAQGNGFSDRPVYPNPSCGIFRFETPQPSTYRIYDLFGRMIEQGKFNGVSEIDITDCTSGIYLVNVQSENGNFLTKLVKH